MDVQTAIGPAEAGPAAPDDPLPPLPTHWRSLARAFVHCARERPGAAAMADSTGASLTFGEVLLRALALGRALGRELGPAAAEPNVGVLLPPTVPAAVTNVALVLLGRVAVNLNYTASQEALDSAIDQAGIRHIVTAQKALARFPVRPKGGLLILEDLAKRVSALDKVRAAVVAKAVPIAAMGAFVPGLRGDSLDATATIIFTSGSTGEPKGVVLSQRNILSNIHQIRVQVRLEAGEVVLGVLPFFHSFGFDVPLWAVLTLGFQAVYHYNPLDARTIGDLAEKHKATIILATPTFMRAYLKRCTREQFATMRLPILGAEKLKPALEQEIRDGLGIVPLQGYGCTELSPVVAVNVPHDLRTRDGRTVPGNRLGSVGRPLPGTTVKAIDPETRADLPRGTEGLLLVAGPQVMVGYLGRPEATARVVRGGWYETGDLGYVDADGFLWITDRLSRFAKIGGEMVPHLKVEVALQEAAGVDESQLAVTSLPDPKRGERLVVVHTALGISPGELCRRLAPLGLPNLWHPAPDAFVLVDALPLLGSGKLDLRRLRQIAEERLREPG